MQPIQWQSETEFEVGGLRFLCALNDYTLKTNQDRVVILKNRHDLASYARVFEDGAPKNMLEFGIFQGGSPALFSLWFELERFVGIDFAPAVTEFDALCRDRALDNTIRNYYGVSQTDQLAIEDIIKREFENRSLDVIIDDASHNYDFTKRTFEIAFPFLKPGGCYVIEDWGWAHWPNSPFFKGDTALSMLVMELIMLSASRRDIIEEIRVFPSFAFVIKSSNAPTLTQMSLDQLYNKRGLGLIGPKHLRFSEVWKILVERVKSASKS